MLTADEREELELLRRSAALFITDPLQKAFFELERLIERNRPTRVDSVMPTSAFFVLEKALRALKDDYLSFKQEMKRD